MTSVTPSYKKYLMHFGMPRFVVPVVMSSRESLSVTDFGNGTFRTKLATGTGRGGWLVFKIVYL